MLLIMSRLFQKYANLPTSVIQETATVGEKELLRLGGEELLRLGEELLRLEGEKLLRLGRRRRSS